MFLHSKTRGYYLHFLSVSDVLIAKDIGKRTEQFNIIAYFHYINYF